MTWRTGVAIIAMALLTVGGDYLLKVASRQDAIFRNWWFAGGALVYALGAFGWTFAFRNMTMASVGALYSTVTIILLAGIGVVVFRERLAWSEGLGIVLAMLSIGLLFRRV